MLEINFYSEEGEMENLWNFKEFQQYMVESGLGEVCDLNENSSYEDSCDYMCENAVSWQILKLLEGKYSLEDIFVNEGTFDNQHHIWLRIGEYFIDLTLCQFLTNCPELAITKVSEVTNKDDLYFSSVEYSAEDWINMLFSQFINN